MKSGIYRRRRRLIILSQFFYLFFSLFLSKCVIVKCSSESWDDDGDNVNVPVNFPIMDYYENPSDNNDNNININIGDANELQIPMESENEISWDKKEEDENNSVKKLEEILTYVSDVADATNLGPMLHKEIESTLLHKNKNRNKNKNKNHHKKSKDKHQENDKKKKTKNKQKQQQKNTQTDGDKETEIENGAKEDKDKVQNKHDSFSFDKTQKVKVNNNNKPDQTLKPTKTKQSQKLTNETVNTVKTEKEDILSNNNNDEKTTRWKKKLKIPKGSTLSVSFQITRPNVLPGLFYQPEGIVMDAVIEIPVAFELDEFAEHVYSQPPKPWKPFKPLKPPKPELPGKPEIAGKPELAEGGPELQLDEAAGEAEEEEEEASDEVRSNNEIIGYERCFLYNQLEIVAARTMEVTQDIAHACILRTICELHSLLSFKPHFKNASVLFELIRLFFTPSLGVDDKCFRPYLKAERSGRKKGLCYSYATQCPVSFATVILANFVPIFAPGYSNQ